MDAICHSQWTIHRKIQLRFYQKMFCVRARVWRNMLWFMLTDKKIQQNICSKCIDIKFYYAWDYWSFLIRNTTEIIWGVPQKWCVLNETDKWASINSLNLTRICDTLPINAIFHGKHHGARMMATDS